MDGSVLEHSDSDSGESWTILEGGPSYADDAPDFVDHPSKDDGLPVDIPEKDEDTDGISIITDSDPESSTPCELTYDKCLLEENCPPKPQLPEFISVNPVPPNNHDHQHESIRDGEDFLGDNNGKLKTYVHKRNRRLSTMLNIIVLGSVITAAGVAIGHMWGARNDCSLHATPAVNKILSNLYKLQEENAFLRSKIRELTIVNNFQMLQRKTETERPLKAHKCRKVFEESLTNTNTDKLTKCVDNDGEKILDVNIPDYEKEFLSDIEKLKNIYQQNKSWLDEEIAKRMKREEEYVNRLRVNNLKSPKSIKINEDLRSLNERVKRQTAAEPPLIAEPEEIINVTEPLSQSVHTVEVEKKIVPDRRITYADSLKSSHKVVKRDINEMNTEKSKIRDHIKKRKPPKEFDKISENSSDEELKKDDRYVAHKFKVEKKKNDRQKIHKKQKRKNKYEQWEMKGGYLKDYDDFSITSSHENEFVLKNPDKNYLSKEFERNNYINQFSDTVDLKKPSETVEAKAKSENQTAKSEGKGKQENWYEKRAALRSEARRKLEQELFGESSPNTAQWYFRRMQRREQCRVARHNATQKRLAKRIINYKTKH